MTTLKTPPYYARTRRDHTWSSVTEKTKARIGGKTTTTTVGALAVERLIPAAERVVMAAGTTGVSGHTTTVEEALVTETTVTHQGLRLMVEHQYAVREVVLGDATGVMVGAAWGGGQGERMKGARGRPEDGTSSSSGSTVDSSADKGETAGIWQLTHSLVDIASCAEPLSKFTVTCDRAKSVSSGLTPLVPL